MTTFDEWERIHAPMQNESPNAYARRAFNSGMKAALESRVLAERKPVAWKVVWPNGIYDLFAYENDALDAAKIHRGTVIPLFAHPTPDDASQWISVDDRLPSWTDGRTSKTKVYVMARTSGGVEKECGFFLAGPNGCFDDHDFSPLHRVTHWKPLDAAIDAQSKDKS